MDFRFFFLMMMMIGNPVRGLRYVCTTPTLSTLPDDVFVAYYGGGSMFKLFGVLDSYLPG